MTPVVEGGRPIGRMRVLGFPVTIDISFVIIVAILGWTPGVTAQAFVVWLVLVPVAVLVHELGHAVVARTTGAEPSITLAGLGGLTSYLPPRPLSRAKSIAISVAGPVVGIVIGVALLVYGRSVGVSSELGRTILNTAIYTTLGWSLLNLLPILPLDGGQTLRELLPGSPARREVRAAAVSIVVAVAAAFLAYRAGLVFGALLAAFFVLTNVMTIRSAREAAKVDPSQRAVQLLWGGQPDAARQVLADLPDASAVHPLVRAAVRAATDDPCGGQRELEDALRRDPRAHDAALLLLGVHQARADWTAAHDLVVGPSGDALDPTVVHAVQTVALRAGAGREAARIGTAYLDRRVVDSTAADSTPAAAGPDPDRAEVAFATALGWASVGEGDRGLAAFRRAANLGFADLTAVDGDQRLAALRPMPGYDEARSLVRARALRVVDES